MDVLHPLPRPAAALAGNIALAIAYAALGVFGISAFSEQHPGVTLIWLPTGLSLAALLLWGPSLLPGALAGAALARALSGASVPAAALSGIGGLCEAAVGWVLLARVGISPRLTSPRDLFLLAIVGALAAPTLGTTADLAALHLDGAVSRVFGSEWWIGWIGRAGGVAVVTPASLILARGSPPWRSLARSLEGWVLAVSLVLTVLTVFSGVITAPTPRLVSVFLPYLLMVWAGLRLGPRGAMGIAALCTACTLVGRSAGTPPLGEQAHILPLWTYLVSMSVTAIVLSTTMSQRDAADRELRDLEDQVRHAQRLEGIGLLAGSVAHDFNNLLLVIQANASLLEPVGRQAEYVAEIEVALRQAADLCRQLLTYAGRSSPTLTRVDLRAVADEMHGLLRAKLPEAVRVEVDARPARAALADATQVRQVVMNLILNASEAIGERGGRIRIGVGEMEADARYLRQTFLHADAAPGTFAYLEVEDDGRGMDEDTLRRAFDPFFTTKQSGRGLGLMTVAGVARSHNGAIKVTSEPRRGSRFRLLLPLWTGGPLEEAEEIPHPQPAPRAQGATVLLADDEPAVLRATERILRRSGYAVLTARDGAEAVELYRVNAERVDVILMDVSMPGLTGPRAAAAIREGARGEPVPVVLMSGNLPDGTLSEAAGVRILTKPFGVDTLLEALEEALAGERTAGPTRSRT